MCLRLMLDNILYGAGVIKTSAYLCRSWMYAPAAWIIFCHESSLKWLQSEQSSSCLGLIDIQEIKKQTELFDECRLYNLGEMRDLHYLIVFLIVIFYICSVKYISNWANSDCLVKEDMIESCISLFSYI